MHGSVTTESEMNACLIVQLITLEEVLKDLNRKYLESSQSKPIGLIGSAQGKAARDSS